MDAPKTYKWIGYPKQTGFSLIEVLVSVFILAIGLLGLAGLQSTGLKANGSAYMLTQATALANDMVDRMRANMPGVAAGRYDNITASPGGSSCYTTSSGCTTAAAAANADALEWYTALAARLPSGTGSVGCVAGTPRNCTVTVMWDNDRSGVNGTGCSGDPTVDLTCHRIQVQL
ncbi:MAG TPA: type IV pilus modification protein PilV [Chromatiales bacterium]|nr:type IV pilus modification protein PilV [Chromatiales bacterium]